MMSFVKAKNYNAGIQDFSTIFAEFIIQTQMLFPHYRASLPVINVKTAYGNVTFEIKHRFNNLEDSKIGIEIPLQIRFNIKSYDVYSDYEVYRKNCLTHGFAHLKEEAFKIQLKSLQGILQEQSSTPSQVFDWIKGTGFWQVYSGQTVVLYDREYKPAMVSIYSNVADLQSMYITCLNRFWNILQSKANIVDQVNGIQLINSVMLSTIMEGANYSQKELIQKLI